MESGRTNHQLSEELDQQRRARQLRLDHFRALAAYWAVPGQDMTAEKCEWQPSPGRSLLHKLKQDGKGVFPLVSEDLGVITPDVEAIRDYFQLASMKVLQYVFDGMNDIHTCQKMLLVNTGLFIWAPTTNQPLSLGGRFCIKIVETVLPQESTVK